MKKLNRARAVATVALAGAVALTAAACSAGGGGGGNGAAPTGGSTPGGDVVFAHVGGIYTEVFEKSAFPELAAKGITVLEDTPVTEAKLAAMVGSGRTTWDVFYGIRYTALGKCGEWFEELDFDRIDTDSLDMDWTTPCSVPLTKSMFPFVYNADTYSSNAPTGWADFFDIQKYPGTRGVMNFAKDGAIEAALLASGVPADKLYPLDFDRAFTELDKIKDHLRFYETGAEQQNAIQSGEVDMMIAWTSRAAESRAAGTNIKMVWNQPIFYSDALAIPKGAPNVDGAYALLNTLIDKNTQQAMVNRLPYGSINSQTSPSDNPILNEFVPDAARANGTEIVRDDEWWAANLDEATQRWTDWVNQ